MIHRTTFDLKVDALAATLAQNGTVLATLPLPDGCVVAGDVVDGAALAGALRELLAGRRVRRARVAIATPRLLSRTLRLPAALTAAEVAAAVRFQAAEVLPIAVADAHVVHWTLPAQDGEQRVVVAALPLGRIAAWKAALAEAGLRHVHLTDGPAALGAVRTAGPGAELVAHLGALTSAVVREPGGCAFVRTAPTGLETLVGRLRDDLGLGTATALALLADLDDPPAGTDPALVTVVRSLVADAVGQAVDEIVASLDFHTRAGDAPAVGRVVACGRGAGLPGLQEALADALALPVDVVPGPSAVIDALPGSPLPPLASGPTRPRGGRSPLIPAAVGSAAALAAAAVAVAVLDHRVEQRTARLEAGRGELAELTREVAVRAPLQGLLDRRAAREAAIRTVLAQRLDWDATLATVSAAAGSTIRLGTLRGTATSEAPATGGPVAGPSLELAGCGPDPEGVAGYVERLEAAPGVREVELRRAQRRDPPCDGTAFGAAVALTGSVAP
jgi:type IV pilus assembly protein PilM